WFFGGSYPNWDQPHNDLWRYVPDTTCYGCNLILSAIGIGTADASICLNDCIDFFDLSTNNPTAWLWNFPGGNPSSSTDQNPVGICYNSTGDFDVTLITTNASGNDTLTLPGFITVNALPTLPVITQNIDTLHCSVANGYQWYFSGTIIPGATNQQLVISQAGDYSVVITNAAGCTASDSIAALLILPQSNFSSSATAGCPNSCFDFTNASLNATGYEWNFPGGNPSLSVQQNPSNICYANPGVYDVTLIASSNFGSDTLLLPAYITIYTPPLVSISQNGNTLTCNPSANSYQWYLGGNQIPGATSQSLTITQTGSYWVTVTDSNNCAYTDTLLVTSIPSPDFAATDTLLCQKFCISFTDQSNNNPISWEWNFPGGAPSSSTDENPANICYDVPGIYDVTLITTNASGNDTLTLHDYITVYPTPPFPTITQVGYTLTSSPATTYQWQFNSIDIPGATNQSYTVLQTGYYTVVVGNSNGCRNSLTVYILISGVNEMDNEDNIFIYPNPSDGHLMVEWLNGPDPIGIASEVSIEVVNVIGQKVFSSIEDIFTTHWRKEIDLSDVARGIYFIGIKTGTEFIKKKILIAD
ncbi:MAG TPA: PKD domain-containing protein, partial [Chitinophagales bacterium]|nr:PKD domain-containing protein [Chitinophagales bacterium]